jgi:ABC-2 type transport system permease protein
VDLIYGPIKRLTRISSFITKELIEIVRRPGALITLVFAPFLIMTLFGLGYSNERKPLETVIVLPPGADLPKDPGFYQTLSGPAVHIVGVTEDIGRAREMLIREQIDLIVAAPKDVEQQFLAGHQSVIEVEYNLVDPIRDSYARFIARSQVEDINREIIQRVVGQSQQYVLRSSPGSQLTTIPPEVIAAPTKSETRNLSPYVPSVVIFYSPAVLALVLQHIGVTLTALSNVRERSSGIFEIFRVAPVGAVDILIGKYFAYILINGAIAAVSVLLLVRGLGVPMLGGWELVASVIGLLTLASLGLGFLISAVSDSERQAVQLSMLVLLASVFFSGFVLPLDQFSDFVRPVAYALPVTYGIRLLQDVMLRGGTFATWQFYALAGMAAVLFLLSALRFKWQLSHQATER